MRFFLCFLPLFICFSACQKTSPQQQAAYDIIPLPASMTPQPGHFVLEPGTRIVLEKEAESLREVALYFASVIHEISGFELKVKDKAAKKNNIIFQLDEKIAGDEAYHLSLSASQIIIQSRSARGAFYAIQTLRQLYADQQFPAVEIEDAPRFPYRGMHLDVARHFFDVAAVKRYIDQLAFHKLNHFHWHLTDDQGWRIEIKKYPKLTEIGAFRKGTLIGHYNDQPHQFDGKRYGGFYTQEEIKEVVAYAASRFVTIVPEIEMPGHAQAPLAAYPELGCTGEQLEVWQLWGVSENVYCPKEETFAFLEDVLTEVMALFPGKYIHIGGDESPKTQWEQNAFCQELIRREGLKDEHELQSYFIRRIERFVNSQGRRIIGWDEILEGGLAPNATVMSWRGISGGIEAAQSGHDVIMTPTSHCYLDYYQSDHPDEPLAIGGFIPLEKVYGYEPIPAELEGAARAHVLGAQANLWTEYIPTVEKLDYMIFPRLCALAELVWSPADKRDFDHFAQRLSPHLDRLKGMGIHCANHLYDLNAAIQPQAGKVEVKLNIHAKEGSIHYTRDGSEPTPQSPLYEGPLQLDSSAYIRAQAFRADGKPGRAWEQKIVFHKATGKHIQLTHQPHDKYKGGGNGSVLNGVLGSDERYGDAEWLGFDGNDFEAMIDMGQDAALIKAVHFRFFKGEGQWIYLPAEIHILTSSDGKEFKEIAVQEEISGENKVVEVTMPLHELAVRYLKIIAKNHGTIAPGRQGAGNKAWLFVDELRVY